MVQTAQQVINSAYYLSSVVSKGDEIVSGQQINEGLTLLNQVLNLVQVSPSLVQFFTTYNFVATNSKEEYLIPRLVEFQTVTYTIDDSNTVRYPCLYRSRSNYFGVGRTNNLVALPEIYTFERTLGGSYLYVYPLPQANYNFQITGKFIPEIETLQTDLNLFFTDGFILYLTYDLARLICYLYNKIFPQMEMYQQLRNELSYTSPFDFNIQKISGFVDSTVPNYAQINIGRGYTP